MPRKCEDCDGRGVVDITCLECDGGCYASCISCGHYTDERCPTCKGDGKEEMDCEFCGGTGELS